MDVSDLNLYLHELTESTLSSRISSFSVAPVEYPGKKQLGEKTYSFWGVQPTVVGRTGRWAWQEVWSLTWTNFVSQDYIRYCHQETLHPNPTPHTKNMLLKSVKYQTSSCFKVPFVGCGGLMWSMPDTQAQDPSTTWKLGMPHVPEALTLGTEESTREIAWAHWGATLGRQWALGSVRPCLKTEENKRGRHHHQLLASTCKHMKHLFILSLSLKFIFWVRVFI